MGCLRFFEAVFALPVGSFETWSVRATERPGDNLGQFFCGLLGSLWPCARFTALLESCEEKGSEVNSQLLTLLSGSTLCVQFSNLLKMGGGESVKVNFNVVVHSVVSDSHQHCLSAFPFLPHLAEPSGLLGTQSKWHPGAVEFLRVPHRALPLHVLGVRRALRHPALQCAVPCTLLR